MATVLRMLRTVRGEALDFVAARLGSYKKPTLSTAERFPHQAGPRLRKALSRYYRVPWSQLAKSVSPDAIAKLIIAHVQS